MGKTARHSRGIPDKDNAKAGDDGFLAILLAGYCPKQVTLVVYTAMMKKRKILQTPSGAWPNYETDTWEE